MRPSPEPRSTTARPRRKLREPQHGLDHGVRRRDPAGILPRSAEHRFGRRSVLRQRARRARSQREQQHAPSVRIQGVLSGHRASSNGKMRCYLEIRRMSPLLAEPQPRATRRRHAAGRAGADPGRRRLGQDPRADHAHRLADPDRPGVARRRAGRDLHQQGGEGDADAPRRDAADQRARHVDRHLPRPVQPLPARALEARRRCRRASRSSIRRTSCRRSSACIKAMNLDEERYPPQAGARGSSPAPRKTACAPRTIEVARRADAQAWSRSTRPTKTQCQREGVVDFAELMLRTLRAAARQRAAARALPAALPPHPGRRVPGHQPAAVRLAEDVRRPAGAAAARCSRSATTTRASTPSAARRSATWPTSSASSGSERSSSSSRTTARYGNILDAANELIAHNTRRLGKNLRTDAGPGEPVRVLRGAQRLRRGAVVRRGGAGSCTARARRAREIALLYRSNAQCRVIESALFNAGIPYRSTAACASSSAPRSSTRWPTCG